MAAIPITALSVAAHLRDKRLKGKLTAKRAQNILSPEDVDRLYELYCKYEDVEDFSKVVTIDDIAAKGYDLSPNKYVNYHKEEIRPYAEVLAEFKAAYEEVLKREAEFEKLINA